MSTTFIDGFLASDAGAPFAGIRQDAEDILAAFLEAAACGPDALASPSIEAALRSVVPRLKKQRLSDAPSLFAAFIVYAGAHAGLKDAAPLSEEARHRATELAKEDAEKRQPARSTGPAVGRNDPCPCGSGKKHKRCCAGTTDVNDTKT